MLEAFVRKLLSDHVLSREDVSALEGIPRLEAKLGRDRNIERASGSEFTRFVVSGWAARHTLLPDGRIQITSFVLPGDFLDLDQVFNHTTDERVRSVTSVTVASIPTAAIMELISRNTRLNFALFRCMAEETGRLRGWLVNIGRRYAVQRVAYLLLELHRRVTAIGVADGMRFYLPITQEQFGDATGLTAVHVNRMVRRLRDTNIIRWKSKEVEILDVDRLVQLAALPVSSARVAAPAPGFP